MVTEFDKTALTNVESEHWKLWIYIVAIYMITIMTLYVRSLDTPPTCAPLLCCAVHDAH